MPHDAFPESTVALDLIGQMARARDRAQEDPFGNPVLAVALAISRQMDEGELTASHLAALIRELRDSAFAARARRLAAYVGYREPGEAVRKFQSLAARLVRPDPSDSPVQLAQFRADIERTRFAAVFTAHPTFANPAPVFHALAEEASGRPCDQCFVSHRPEPITLVQEFEAARLAILNGRDALDALNRALLTEAQNTWPDRWMELLPRPVILTSWVGYDTDGRTDIGWWDTLRLRLTMKQAQLQRVLAQVARVPEATPLLARLNEADDAVTSQLATCPAKSEAEKTQAFAHALVTKRDQAVLSPVVLAPLFAAAMKAADAEGKMTLAVARAGLFSHGMSLAHTHVRLNATQVHNAVRLRLGFDDVPGDAARRRTLLATLNQALDVVQPQALNFGALLAEQASATKLMMTVAQIIKHIDAATPIRFLIAETESGATLLAALWLARLFGIDQLIEISPLFETADALEHGSRLVEEALRSPHYRAYLRDCGRLCLQFGYSDSGRYVGQIAASYLIERLRMKVADLMQRFNLTDVELVLFDTHGESIGRGGHPGSLQDRLRYLSPAAARRRFADAGIAVREESAFQGGDGFALFGTPELATSVIATIANHAYDRSTAAGDAVYEEGDFAADFFTSVGLAMQGLVEDRGYAALLGAFGPALLDPTGSRPTARQSDTGGPAVIKHPRELRAIPNNAILQQLGWCANTLQGVGTAAARMPEQFAEMHESSPRFRRALDFVNHGLKHSDLDVLRAVISLIDPGSWLDRAAQARLPGRMRALADVATALEALDMWAPAQAMFRRIQADHVRLREAWPGAPHMETEEMLLHALRVALISRIWLLATGIPEFSPRHGITRDALLLRILRLDVPAALAILAEVFPASPDPAADRDYAEPGGPRAVASYEREHRRIFAPLARLFGLVREIGTAVTHHVGAYG
ncbi:MAG TPA: phosphoenolpyruvate carboxylase [Acetobacteraceae bacterium]|nr:phosphoenolpyruvate carboxylase [Acetobacteraceae bacterium]